MERRLVDQVKLGGASYLVLGLMGYTDAGWVASFSSSFIINRLKARRIGELKEGGFVLSSARPIAVIKRGLVEEVAYPRGGEVFLAGRVVVIRGEEPHLSWRSFLDEVLGLVEGGGIVEVYTLGGLVDFSEEARVSAVVSLPKLQGLVEACGAELINYEGPCSIYTALIERCAYKGISAISLWGHVPYRRYAVLSKLRAPDVDTSYRVLKVLCRLTKISLPLEELEEEARRQLDVLRDVEAMDRGGGEVKFSHSY